MFSANAENSLRTDASFNLSSVYQDERISGTVVDQEGNPVIGANVIIKGTQNGTITDLDGKFILENCPANAILQVSYIGYQTQEVVPEGTSVKVTLREDSQNLEEVVVVGYGSSVKKDLTTAVTSVKSKDFLQGAVNDAMQLVDGKVAGVTVNTQPLLTRTPVQVFRSVVPLH